MPSAFTSIRMSDLTSLEAYTLLASLVVPRPIAFVSTCSASGVANLAPFSFFMVGGTNPPSLMYSPTLNGQGQAKDSLRNVLETGEFVVNMESRGRPDFTEPGPRTTSARHGARRRSIAGPITESQ